jgi:hypothetical protein
VRNLAKYIAIMSLLVSVFAVESYGQSEAGNGGGFVPVGGIKTVADGHFQPIDAQPLVLSDMTIQRLKDIKEFLSRDLKIEVNSIDTSPQSNLFDDIIFSPTVEYLGITREQLQKFESEGRCQFFSSDQLTEGLEFLKSGCTRGHRTYLVVEDLEVPQVGINGISAEQVDQALTEIALFIIHERLIAFADEEYEVRAPFVAALRILMLKFKPSYLDAARLRDRFEFSDRELGFLNELSLRTAQLCKKRVGGFTRLTIPSVVFLKNGGLLIESIISEGVELSLGTVLRGMEVTGTNIHIIGSTLVHAGVGSGVIKGESITINNVHIQSPLHEIIGITNEDPAAYDNLTSHVTVRGNIIEVSNVTTRSIKVVGDNNGVLGQPSAPISATPVLIEGTDNQVKSAESGVFTSAETQIIIQGSDNKIELKGGVEKLKVTGNRNQIEESNITEFEINGHGLVLKRNDRLRGLLRGSESTITDSSILLDSNVSDKAETDHFSNARIYSSELSGCVRLRGDQINLLGNVSLKSKGYSCIVVNSQVTLKDVNFTNHGPKVPENDSSGIVFLPRLSLSLINSFVVNDRKVIVGRSNRSVSIDGENESYEVSSDDKDLELRKKRSFRRIRVKAD